MEKFESGSCDHLEGKSMTGKESTRVETLGEFLDWADRFVDGQYLFRGVPDGDYTIIPSTFLRLRDADRNVSKLLQINEKLIETARRQGNDQKNGQRLNDLDLLAELQHYGAATCLIDFTYSALVALFFACEPSSKEKPTNGKVYAVASDSYLKVVDSELAEKNIAHFLELDETDFFSQSESDKYPLYRWEPKFQNNRIIAQQSVFVFGSMSVIPEAECIIPASSKQTILKSLKNLSNIDAARMYPDFDGLVRLHAYDKPYIEPNAHIYREYGDSAYQRGDMDRAIENYEMAINVNPNYEGVYNNCGLAHLQKRDYDRAIENFNKAIDLKPDAGTYFNRGLAHFDKRQYDRAIEDYTEAIDRQLEPDNSEAYYNRGKTYRRKGEYTSAIEDFTAVINLRPEHARAYFGCGLTYYEIGDYARAIENYSKAIEMNPHYTLAYNYRWLAFLHLRKWTQAKSDLITAKDKGKNVFGLFNHYYESVADFEARNNLKLPEDIVAMLTTNGR